MSKIKQKTSYFLLISFIFLLSCGGFKEAGKVLRNEKTNSTDEFLVKKREPLILPPDYEKVPEPFTANNKKEGESDKIKKILNSPIKEETTVEKLAIEDSIIKKIKQ